MTRAQIVAAADRLFYEHGFEHTSFTAIADAARIARGNSHYYFKTKDDILAAVIAARLAETRRMLRQWEAEASDPVGRIRRFIRIVLVNGPDIRGYGCPVGTLTAELAKLRHPCRSEAAALFTVFRAWLRGQFIELAVGRGAGAHSDAEAEAEADALALHVLAFSQGVATLSNAFGDEDFVRREVDRMEAWLAGYAAGAASRQ